VALCGHSEPFRGIWPTSGTQVNGCLYELPMLALPMDDSESSSSPGLLRTPTAQLAVNGGSRHPDKRKAGGHGPTLADEVEHLLPTPTSRDGKGANQRRDDTCLHGALLPTPRATDGTKGGPNQRGSSGDLMLPSAVTQLLPTPRVTTGGSIASGTRVRDVLEGRANETEDCRLELTVEVIAARSLGATTNPRFDGGNT
jgi:hypothetical protein